VRTNVAEIAQLGERQTEDLKVTGSIPVFGIFLLFLSNLQFFLKSNNKNRSLRIQN
jgi:hypothetical protein